MTLSSARRQRRQRCAPARQRGFSAVLVLAVVVMMGGLVAYGVTTTSATSATLAQDLASARAQQAANTGLEWARYRLRTGAACATVSATITVPLTSGAFPVTVTCTTTSPTGGFSDGATVQTYRLIATACNPAPSGSCPDTTLAPNYVQRQVTGIAEGP